jgi:nucleotidyltransferase/DNA polymerase involved in DNA repair
MIDKSERLFYICSHPFQTEDVMKIAYIHIQDFPIQVEILENPAIRQTSVVIGGMPDDEGTVYACSPAARIDGVQPGMLLRQAEQLSPQAAFLPLSQDLYDQAHKGLLEALSLYSPFRESSAPGRIYLDVSGFERLYGSDDELLEQILQTIQNELSLLPQVGLAANKFAAETAARLSDPGSGQVVHAGAEREFLAPLPLILLPSSDDAYRLLSRLGLETIGQVAEMPVGALSRTFGKEGLLLHSLASGKDLRPLMPQFEAAPLSVETHLEFPLDNLEQLSAYSDRLASQLTAELEASALVAGALIVEVDQEYGEALSSGGYLRPASSDHRLLSDRATGLLSTLEYASGVTALKLGLFPLHPFHIESKQLGLFRPKSFTQQNPIQRLVGSIQERFGEAAIIQATAVEGPAPEPIEVRTGEDGYPSALVRNNSWKRVATIDLHWRLEGDWWWGEGRKDYYKVVTRTGEILVLFHESKEDRWCLHPGAQPNSWPLS